MDDTASNALEDSLKRINDNLELLNRRITRDNQQDQPGELFAADIPTCLSWTSGGYRGLGSFHIEPDGSLSLRIVIDDVDSVSEIINYIREGFVKGLDVQSVDPS